MHFTQHASAFSLTPFNCTADSEGNPDALLKVSSAGTPAYMSPECLAQQPQLGMPQRGQRLPINLIKKGDIWSGNICNLELVQGRRYWVETEGEDVDLTYFHLEAAARSLSSALQVSCPIPACLLLASVCCSAL